MPHRIILLPLAVLYALLTAVAGPQSTALALLAAGVFALAAGTIIAGVPSPSDRRSARWALRS